MENVPSPDARQHGWHDDSPHDPCPCLADPTCAVQVMKVDAKQDGLQKTRRYCTYKLICRTMKEWLPTWRTCRMSLDASSATMSTIAQLEVVKFKDAAVSQQLIALARAIGYVH